ncbi:MAG: DUF4271 domain-containing protein [Bacteroidales bacterium]|jgi:hypothetical protein|nr:DUF4271 domain-containing protein [Bacteroidales bacterium]
MNISDPIDTFAVCIRNTVSDVTFYDSANLVTRIDKTELTRFPYQFTEKNSIRETAVRETLTKHLKDGREMPVRSFHDDWIVLVVLVSAFLYSVFRTVSKRMISEVTRFIFSRGIGDPASRDIAALFHWESTIMNLITFFNLALFAYCTALYYDSIPSGISGFLYWIIALGIIVAAITIRHITCYFTGKVSTENNAFNEYIVTIYLSYRMMALVLFVLVILISYTRLFPVKVLFLTGFITISILYLMRIIRLFLIFIKRNISVLYLILYLCALEFLPVVIIVKYFTGLF